MKPPLFGQLHGVIGQGSHLCLVCNESRLKTTAAAKYICDGLQNGECAIYAADAAAEAELVTSLSAAGVDVAHERARGALFFPGAEAAYPEPGGTSDFDPQKMLEIFRRKLADARGAGFVGCRFAGEPTWAISRSNLVPSLIEFEALLNDFFPSQPACGLCVYDRRAWPASVIRDVLRTHQVAVIDDIVCCNNPFYERPDLVLEPQPDEQRVAWMLDRLRAGRRLELDFEETQAQLRSELCDIKLLRDVSGELVEEENVETLYGKIMDAAVVIMRSDFASMQMLYGERGKGGELRLLASRGFTPEALRFWEWVSTNSQCTCGVALRTGIRSIATDVEQCDFIMADHQRTYLQAGIYAAQSTPLVSRTGNLVGMISTHWRKPHQPAERDLRLLDILARQAADLLERKQAENARDLLSEELNHCVKNTLASVHAIVQHTLRNANDPADFASSISGRIQSMARVHSLLTSAAWKGADLRDVIRDQLLQGPVDETRLTAWGPAVRLEPQLAQHIALMLHELGTNATKYGALSTAKGWVTISWTVEDKWLRLKWVERAVPPASAPIKRGFGTTLVEESARGQGGTAQMTIEAEGIAWEIAMPLPRDGASRGSPADSSTMLQAEKTLRREVPATGTPTVPLAGRRFLVVEDEPLVALDLIACLEEAGAEVAGRAGTREAALHLIESPTFDTALLDCNLHGRPVDDIAAALTRRGVPFIFVTGYGQESLPRAFGRTPMLPKPFSRQQLLQAVTQLVTPRENVVRLVN